MTLRRTASAAGTMGLVLTAHTGVAAAHGVEVTAEVDDTIATLKLTDETGEICLTATPAPEPTSVLAIVDDASDEVLVILGEGFGEVERCGIFDAETVNGVLDDVDAHRLVIAFGNTEASGVLTKPQLGDSETATASTSVETAEADVNVPLVFGIGAALGIAGVVIRKRFFSSDKKR